MGPRQSHEPFDAPRQQVLAAVPVSHFAYAPSNAPLQARVHSRNRIVQQIPPSQSYVGSGRTSYRKIYILDASPAAFSQKESAACHFPG